MRFESHALAHYEHALELDPLYAAAYAGSPTSTCSVTDRPGWRDCRSRWRRHAGPSSWIASWRPHTRRSAWHSRSTTGTGRPQTARSAAASSWTRANATAHHWYAEYLVTQGRFDEALDEARTAEALDPLSFIISWNVARILAFTRRHDEAIAKLRALQRLHGADTRVNVLLAAHLLGGGERDEAADVLDRFGAALESAGRDSAVAARLRLVGDEIRRGRDEALIELLSDGAAGGGHGDMFRAAYLAHTGRNAEALDVLERAYADRTLGLTVPDLAAGEMFDPLRDEPRFQNILRAMKLDPDVGRRLRDADLRDGRPRYQSMR